MKVMAIKDVEDCFDGSFIKEIHLESTTTEKFIRELGKDFSLEYFPEFPRPFFRIIDDQQFQIKGVLNSLTLRVIFNRGCDAKCVENLVLLINQI